MNTAYIRHHFIGHLLLQNPIIVFSCQVSPSDKISILKGKPLQISESYQRIYLELCCLYGSNWRKLYSLLLTLNSVKGQSLRVGMFCLFLGQNEKLKAQEQKRNKSTEKNNCSFSLEFTEKFFPASFVHINCNVVFCFG